MRVRKSGLACMVSLLLVLSLFYPFGLTSSIFANAEPEPASAGHKVKVATYNIAAGSGTDGQFDLDRTIAAIRESGADIIGLQEVDVHWGSRSDFVDEVQILAEALDMQSYFAPIYDMDPAQPGEPRRQFGLAVLSKYPILEANNHEITRLSTQEPDPEPKPAPGFLEALIDVDGSHLWFYVTHLDYRSDPAVREMQVADMQQVMSKSSNTILVGDLNARPDADELQPLFDTFTDVWNAAGDGDGFTFPADAPDRRIDYILTAPDIDVHAADVGQSQASDHLLVTSTIALRSTSADAMKTLVERFAAEGEFANEEAVHALTVHLIAVARYEGKELADKVVKHMQGFKQLLDHQQEKEWISEDAYDTLQADADAVIRANTGVDAEGFYRAFWVQAFEPGLKTPDEIDQLVADVEAANMNAIVAQVSRRHDAYYESDVLPFTEDPAVPEGFDSLGYLLEATRDKNIEVHAWVTVGPMWHSVYGGPPKDPNHIWNVHGPDASDDETWVTMGYDGTIGDRSQPYLDLGNPEAVDHVVRMVTDIVENYDVDGIHLDYIRYPENPGGKPIGWHGYNPTALERFLEETGRTVKPEPGDAEWLEWKAAQVDHALKRVYLELMAKDMDVRLTAAVVSWGFDDPRTSDWWRMDPVQRAHQNWKKWVQEGYLDFAFVMNYDSDADPARAERFDAWIEWEKDLPRNRGIVIGPALYMNTIPDSISQIHRALAPSPNGNTAEGVSPYVYNVWSSDGSSREDLIRSLSQPTEWNDGNPPFTEPIGTPEMPWKQQSHGHVLGQVVDPQGQAVSDVRVTLYQEKNGPVAAEVRTDGNGFFGITDLKPGEYLVDTDHSEKNDVRVEVLPGQVTRIQF